MDISFTMELEENNFFQFLTFPVKIKSADERYLNISLIKVSSHCIKHEVFVNQNISIKNYIIFYPLLDEMDIPTEILNKQTIKIIYHKVEMAQVASE